MIRPSNCRRSSKHWLRSKAAIRTPRWSFAALRFLVGLAIGSEWATGASITAELWPNHARGKGGAFLQCGYPIGSIIAPLACCQVLVWQAA